MRPEQAPAPDARRGDDGHVSEAEAFEQTLYLITHDLRACLRGLQTIPDWIREDLEEQGGTVPKAVCGYIDLLKTQAARADRMLLDLRDYGRIGRYSDPPERMPLDALVQAAAAQVGLPEGFELRCQPDMPEVSAPPGDMTRLIAALLRNAAVHHDHAQGVIAVAAQMRSGTVTLTVRDDGPGIPAEHHAQAFAVLKTLRPRDVCEGSGMGLAMVRKIAESLGGRAWIDASNAPRGTTVRVALPAPPTGGP